jgi:hypothetical protein
MLRAKLLIFVLGAAVGAAAALAGFLAAPISVQSGSVSPAESNRSSEDARLIALEARVETLASLVDHISRGKVIKR